MSVPAGNSLRLKAVLFLLCVLLFGGFVFLYTGDRVPVKERLVTLRSGGGSLGGRDRVMVRGDEISYGERVEVLNRSLMVSLTDSSVILAFEPESRWRFRGLYGPSRRLEVSVRGGKGRVHARERMARLVFPSRVLHLENGWVRWELNERNLELRRGTNASGYLMNDGSTVPLSELRTHPNRSGSPGVGREAPDLPRTYSGPPAQSSSLISGERLRERIEGIARRTGKYPRTVREVFGHWVRDRWGNVYYYDPNPDGFTLISGGPDERLFTDDDRRWTE